MNDIEKKFEARREEFLRVIWSKAIHHQIAGRLDPEDLAQIGEFELFRMLSEWDAQQLDDSVADFRYIFLRRLKQLMIDKVRHELCGARNANAEVHPRESYLSDDGSLTDPLDCVGVAADAESSVVAESVISKVRGLLNADQLRLLDLVLDPTDDLIGLHERRGQTPLKFSVIQEYLGWTKNMVQKRMIAVRNAVELVLGLHWTGSRFVPAHRLEPAILEVVSQETRTLFGLFYMFGIEEGSKVAYDDFRSLLTDLECQILDAVTDLDIDVRMSTIASRVHAPIAEVRIALGDMKAKLQSLVA